MQQLSIMMFTDSMKKLQERGSRLNWLSKLGRTANHDIEKGDDLESRVSDDFSNLAIE